MKAQIAANENQAKQMEESKKELANLQAQKEKERKFKSEKDSLDTQIRNLKNEDTNDDIKKSQQIVDELKQTLHYKERNELEQNKARLIAELRHLTGNPFYNPLNNNFTSRCSASPNTPPPDTTAPSTPIKNAKSKVMFSTPSESEQRKLVDSYEDEKREKDELQEYQATIENAEKTKILSSQGEIFDTTQKKKHN